MIIFLGLCECEIFSQEQEEYMRLYGLMQEVLSPHLQVFNTRRKNIVKTFFILLNYENFSKRKRKYYKSYFQNMFNLYYLLKLEVFVSHKFYTGKFLTFSVFVVSKDTHFIFLK